MTGARITVVISTKDRKEELEVALASCLAQRRRPEILVLDDGSSDGTSELVRARFPSVRLVRSERSRGLIAQRNQGARLAETPFIVSMDDDAELSAPDTLDHVEAAFEEPSVGALAMPFIDVKKGPEVKQRAPDPDGTFVVASYIGTAHALRRELFLRLGGYREELFHQGEEADYCIRMLDHGYAVRAGSSPPILHHESPKRDFRRMDLYGRRNDVLYAWNNVPLGRLGPHLLATTANGLRWGLTVGRPRVMAEGLWSGYRAILEGRGDRRPVSAAAYRLSRRLKRDGPLPLAAISAELTQLREASRVRG